MSVGAGIGLFFIGMVVTVIFFMVWFHVMEKEEQKGDKIENN
jgi:hypothetical protein